MFGGRCLVSRALSKVATAAAPGVSLFREGVLLNAMKHWMPGAAERRYFIRLTRRRAYPPDHSWPGEEENPDLKLAS